MASRKASKQGQRRADQIAVPLGLQMQDIRPVQRVLERAPALVESAEELLMAVKAESTLVGYKSGGERFKRFLREHRAGEGITEEVMVHYLLQLNAERASVAIINQVKPAITAMMELAGLDTSFFTPRVDMLIDGAKKLAGSRRGPVKKAEEVELELLKNMVRVYLEPYKDDIFRVNVFRFRVIIRVLVEYYTMCRQSDYRQLQAKHIERDGEDLLVTFPGAKNDQMHEGRSTMLIRNNELLCPVTWMELYYKRFGMKFGVYGGDHTPLHCRINNDKGRRYALKEQDVASAATATEGLNELLKEMGIVGHRITDKSFKSLGVTRTMQNGASAEEVAMLGRWGTVDMPMRYKHNSREFKKAIARKVPYQ